MTRTWDFWLAALMLGLAAVLIGLAVILAFRSRRQPLPPYSAPIHDPRD